MNLEYAKEILRLLRKVQENNRFIVEDNESGLSLAESSALLEVDTFSPISVASLAQHLGVDRSSVSQVADRLIKKKLVRLERGAEKQRGKTLQVTQNGSTLLDQYDLISNQLYRKFVIGFTQDEIVFLGELFNRLGDSRCSVPGKLRHNDNPIRLGMRRMTISFGLLHRNFRGLSVSLAEWNVLSAIGAESCKAVDIIQRIGLAQNYLSQILSKLLRQKFMVRARDLSDRRAHNLSLTSKGQSWLDKINADIEAQIAETLSGYSTTKIEHFIALLKRFTGDENNFVGVIGKRGEFEVRRITDEDRLNSARLLFVREALKQKGRIRIPESIFPLGALVYGVFKDESVLAAVWFDEVDGTLVETLQVRDLGRVDLEIWKGFEGLVRECLFSQPRHPILKSFGTLKI